MGTAFNTGWYWVFTSVLLQSTSAGLGKQAADKMEIFGFTGVLLNPWYIGSLTVLGAQALSWMFALRKLPLSRAYPLMSLVVPMNVVIAWAIFEESLKGQHLLGVALIVLGILPFTRGEKR